MSQDLQNRLLSLEKSARRWKVLALSSWAVLALLLLLCVGLAVREMQAAVAARDAALQAREEAERARQQEREAKEQAHKKQREAEQARKKAEKTSMMQMYQAQILLAQREWERRKSQRPAGTP
jgi:hypothetical protein